jgi:hypothetical protein
MDDSLLGITKRVNANSELCAVLSQCIYLQFGDWVSDRLINICGWDVVVLSRYREIRTTYRATGETEAIKSLRASHFVNEVQVDVQQIGLTLRARDHVICPDLLG